jgi:hypothetical protein
MDKGAGRAAGKFTMTPSPTLHLSKLATGLLLAGISLAASDVSLAATAAGIGGNWIAETVPGFATSLLARRSAGPLAEAYAAAIRQAVKALQADYLRTVDGRSDPTAFRLVALCADGVAAAEFTPTVTTVDTAQRALQEMLAQLLYGHDARQIAYLQERLLPACAQYFQRQLVQEEAAWRAFHGLVLQALAINSAALLPKIDRFTELLAAWSDPATALNAFNDALTRLETTTAQIAATGAATHAGVQRIETKLADLTKATAAPPGVTFNNQGMHVGGNVHQAAGNQYINAAHAEGSGTTIVYNTIGTPTPPPTKPAPRITILFLAANPLETDRLRLDQEARTVDEALRLAKQRDRFQLAQQWAVRTTDLLDALLRYRPQIVHFAGHGSPDGRLLFENDAGEAVAVAAAALGRLFAGVRGIRCVLLNACWSQRHAKVLTKHVDCVVGMPHAVSDTAAIHFVAGFYRTLGEGGSVQQAYDLGCGQLLAAGGEEKITKKLLPRLVTKAGVAADTVRFG